MAFAAEPLTLADAQQRAVARSRQLAAQGFSVQAAREMAAAAERLPDPVLKAGVDNLPVSGPDRFSTGGDFMTMRRLDRRPQFLGDGERLGEGFPPHQHRELFAAEARGKVFRRDQRVEHGGDRAQRLVAHQVTHGSHSLQRQ